MQYSVLFAHLSIAYSSVLLVLAVLAVLQTNLLVQIGHSYNGETGKSSATTTYLVSHMFHVAACCIPGPGAVHHMW